MATKKETEKTAVTMETVAAEVEAMLAKAREEAARIVAEARQSVGAKAVDPEEILRMEADRARGEELVEVKLFRDNGKYKDDVFVGCNGETIAIKRGEKVKIKRKFAEILEHSQRQDFEAARLVERKSKEWETASQKM